MVSTKDATDNTLPQKVKREIKQKSEGNEESVVYICRIGTYFNYNFVRYDEVAFLTVEVANMI